MIKDTIKAAHPRTGGEAETIAAAFLKRHKCNIITSNYRFRGGELDIIVSDGETLVFVEVKYRSGNAFGSAAEQLSVAQQQRLRRGAAIWLGDNDPRGQYPCRFDLLALAPMGPGRLSVEWISDAF